MAGIAPHLTLRAHWLLRLSFIAFICSLPCTEEKNTCIRPPHGTSGTTLPFSRNNEHQHKAQQQVVCLTCAVLLFFFLDSMQYLIFEATG